MGILVGKEGNVSCFYFLAILFAHISTHFISDLDADLCRKAPALVVEVYTDITRMETSIKNNGDWVSPGGLILPYNYVAVRSQISIEHCSCVLPSFHSYLFKKCLGSE